MSYKYTIFTPTFPAILQRRVSFQQKDTSPLNLNATTHHQRHLQTDDKRSMSPLCASPTIPHSLTIEPV